MSIKLMSAAWDLDIPSTEKMVLMCLCDFANDEGAHCWPSVATIGRKTSKSERTVQAALRELEKLGLLRIDSRSGNSSQYVLNPRKICTPAKSAPPQLLHDTPAKSAPHPRKSRTQTTIEPSKNHQDARGAVKCPDGLDGLVWQDWLRVRRKPPTPTAMAAIEREAQRAGITVPQAITIAAENSWQGFKADWMPKRKANVTADGWEIPIA